MTEKKVLIRLALIEQVPAIFLKIMLTVTACEVR
tara:strand:+ start:5352 stop:5453 length:102 start_codon:yes stop_codon:yes gene_type:complete